MEDVRGKQLDEVGEMGRSMHCLASSDSDCLWGCEQRLMHKRTTGRDDELL